MARALHRFVRVKQRIPARPLGASVVLLTTACVAVPDVTRRSGSSGQVMHLAGEFEPAAELLAAWTPEFDPFYAEIVAAAITQVPVTLLVPPGEARRPAILRRLPAALRPRLHLARLDTDSIWIRDFGPQVVRRGGQRAVVDAVYWRGGSDDAVPRALAGSLWNLPVRQLELEFEGGNLLADGTGRCITAEPVEGAVDAAVRAALQQDFGCTTLVVLPALLDEPTGHVDMFATITAPGEVLLGEYPVAEDPDNAARLELSAARLREAGFRVSRLPMPRRSGDQFRTYANALAVNRVVLVPVYRDERSREAEALTRFAAAYPDRSIVPVDASAILPLGGSLHCATLTVPR
jgi:agmatine/peptidylarginine deiminase